MYTKVLEYLPILRGKKMFDEFFDYITSTVLSYALRNSGRMFDTSALGRILWISQS
ncbi:MAG: hypothetical protein QXL96_05040 [Ignisphaera sp.]